MARMELRVPVLVADAGSFERPCSKLEVREASQGPIRRAQVGYYIVLSLGDRH